MSFIIDVRLILIIRYHYDNYVKLYFYMHWVDQNIDQQNIARILMIKKNEWEKHLIFLVLVIQVREVLFSISFNKEGFTKKAKDAGILFLIR